MSYDRNDRGGFQPRGRSFGDRGGSRGGFAPRGRSFGSDRGDRQMFKATCDNCGKECEVPFRPTQGKPVYCSDCFEKMGGRNNSDRPERSDRPAQGPNLNEVNAKLDKILSILDSKVKKEVFVAPIIENLPVEVEVKAPKVKKTKKVASK